MSGVIITHQPFEELTFLIKIYIQLQTLRYNDNRIINIQPTKRKEIH